MMNETHTIHGQNCTTYSFKRVSWTAIIVGALVAFGLGFLLTMFTIALGITAFTMDKNGTYAIAMGGLLGLLVAVIVSMGVAGYVSGYLGRAFCPKKNLGIVYGFTTWSVALLLSAFLASPISHYNMAYSQMVLGSEPMHAQHNPAKTEEKVQNRTEEASMPDALASSAFILFALFFVGAISCCFGASYGMKHDRCLED